MPRAPKRSARKVREASAEADRETGGETAAAVPGEETSGANLAAIPGGDRRGAPHACRADRSGPGAAALVDAGAARRRPGGGGRGGDNGTGGGGAAALHSSSAAGRMASDKPGPGLEPQPVALLAVGAGGGGGAMGEPRGAAGSGSGPVVLPAGMINPSVPIRNIRMKFAVLIGLIQVGEVSNRDIVETVLNLVRAPAPPHPSPGVRALPPRVPQPPAWPPARCHGRATSLLSPARCPTQPGTSDEWPVLKAWAVSGGVRRPSGPLGAFPSNLLTVRAVALRGWRPCP